MTRTAFACLTALTVVMSASNPVLAQDAQACADELGRLAAAFGIDEGRGEAGAAIAQAPGARQGAGLTSDQRREIAGRVEQAREAGARGDSQGCLEGLQQSRTLLRQAGLGGGQPGTAAPAGAVGSGGSGGSAGTPATLPGLGSSTTAPTGGSGAGGGGSDTSGGSGSSGGGSGGGGGG